MLDASGTRRNSPLWFGLLLALVALLSNAVFFLYPAGQRLIPWLSVLFAAVAVILVAVGIWRVLGGTGRARTKILSGIVAVFSLLLVCATLFAFIDARAIPPSANAPKVGDKAPEFTLADTNNHSVSFGQLFTPADGSPPRAVLLVFYRGYW